MESRIAQLLQMAHELGREDRQLAILGEGNVSAKIDDAHFAVKASGCSLANLRAEEVTVCVTNRVLALLEESNLSDESIENRLMEARVGSAARKPSLEAVFHAWLLSLPGVEFVAHCHPLAVNQVLCSPRARDFANRRLFPDQIVYCGPSSVFVPYTDPGLPLAREIAKRTREVHAGAERVPRLVLLENHGIIAAAASPDAALACTLMANKAAAIFAGAAALGGPNFLTNQHVNRIATRRDEVLRRGAVRKPGQ